MKRTLSSLLSTIFITGVFIKLFIPSVVLADSEFLVDAAVEYKFDELGTSTITHKITLENAIATIYAKSYTLSFRNVNLKKVKAFDENNNELRSSSSKNGELSEIKIDFDDAVVGKGSKRKFSVQYVVEDLAQRTGEVWEISIPKLDKPELFRNYVLSLITPLSFGSPSYISPEPVYKFSENDNNIFNFSKDSVSLTGITTAFGEFQVFNFTLNYHLENPLSREVEQEIAIPPDTAFQKVYLEAINPKPTKISLDLDGNWLAKIKLKPRERTDVLVRGTVQIFSKERKISQVTRDSLSASLSGSEFWNTDEAKIKMLASDLKTPKAIYDYVTELLTYDYSRVKPNVVRLGAMGALENPKNAICMEYTDLFIAIARAAGIPAREVNGYAYTENPDIQPISLVSDVLHAWPEYWDENKDIWVAIDPTWGSTTGGLDYFSKLDLRHFTFVVHGADATKPYPPGSYKLGPNPQKDVFVNFGKLPEKKSADISVEAKIQKSVPFFGTDVLVKVTNNGPVAVYNNNPQVYFDNEKKEYEPVSSLLPYSTYEFNIKVPFSILAKSAPNRLSVIFAGTEALVPGIKSSMIVTSLIVVSFSTIIIVCFTIAVIKRKTISIFLHSFVARFRKNVYEKIFKKDNIFKF